MFIRETNIWETSFDWISDIPLEYSDYIQKDIFECIEKEVKDLCSSRQCSVILARDFNARCGSVNDVFP